MERLGIDLSVRVVDPSQYVNRLRSFDFDMVVTVIGQSLSPGNEQREFWHSESADLEGSRNLMGIRNPAVDQLVESLIAAPNRQELIIRTKALDRALLWNYYLIPHWHINYFRVGYWNRFSRPSVTPKYGLGLLTWWEDPPRLPRLTAKTKTNHSFPRPRSEAFSAAKSLCHSHPLNNQFFQDHFHSSLND